jgi:hypothetical protein
VAKQNFRLARCGCILRVTSQTSYSPEYITPTHTKYFHILVQSNYLCKLCTVLSSYLRAKLKQLNK